MTEEKRVLAFDFGASSGRAVVGTFDGRTIHMEEVHRFANDPVMVRGTMYWDVLRLFHEIKQGMTKAHLSGPIASIGIDTWVWILACWINVGICLRIPFIIGTSVLLAW